MKPRKKRSSCTTPLKTNRSDRPPVPGSQIWCDCLMQIQHVALTCRSESDSDRFYRDVLGLEKVGTKTVPAELSHRIFQVHRPLRIVNYRGPQIHFEIFVDDRFRPPADPVTHVCLAVADPEDLVGNCRDASIPVNRIPRDDGTFMTFIRDVDGNLFEIKPLENHG